MIASASYSRSCDLPWIGKALKPPSLRLAPKYSRAFSFFALRPVDSPSSEDYGGVGTAMNTQSTVDSVIRLTESAAQEIRNQLGKPENTGKTLRVYVEQGGCSGLQYSMSFDELRPDDLQVQMHGVTVVVDAFSAK